MPRGNTQDNATNPRALVAAIDHLFHWKKELSFSSHHRPKELSESLPLSSQDYQNPVWVDVLSSGALAPACHWTAFHHPTYWFHSCHYTAGVLQLMHQQAPAKSCGLDPIATSLDKEHAITLAPTTTNMITGHCLLVSFDLSSNRQQLLRCRGAHLWIQRSWNSTDRSPISGLAPGLWLSGSVRDVQARDRRFHPRLRWIILRRCAPRQGTLLTRALSRPRSKWVPGRTVKACVFE